MSQEVKVLVGIGIFTLVILVGAIFFVGKPSSPTQDTSPVDKALLVKADSYQIASDSAKVTIVEFADFQCPACAQAHPVMKRILQDYQGEVNFIFRHFPLPQHKNAISAALAAEAAGEQGQFWQMHDKIYENQKTWAENSRAMEIYTQYAQDLGLDMEKFKQGVESSQFKNKIQRDQGDGNALGINSTPTFFINGQKIAGALSYGEFKARIDAELSKS